MLKMPANTFFMILHLCKINMLFVISEENLHQSCIGDEKTQLKLSNCLLQRNHLAEFFLANEANREIAIVQLVKGGT
jgi:hypothetical protein